MSEHELKQAQDIVTAIVEEAGVKLLEYFTSGNYSSHSKGGVDFATEADDAIDAFITRELKSQFPDSHFLTEESVADDYLKFRDFDNVWIIDPIDGTLNFSRGNPYFSISVALADKTDVKLGVVSLPAMKKVYTAIATDDAPLLSGEKISVSKTSELEKAVIACDWSWNMDHRKRVYELLSKVLYKVRGSKTNGSAAADLASLAEGNIDGYFISGIHPWDMAASVLFIQKAGGTLTRLDGGQWDIYEREVLASNGKLHDELVRLLNS